MARSQYHEAFHVHKVLPALQTAPFISEAEVPKHIGAVSGVKGDTFYDEFLIRSHFISEGASAVGCERLRQRVSSAFAEVAVDDVVFIADVVITNVLQSRSDGSKRGFCHSVQNRFNIGGREQHGQRCSEGNLLDEIERTFVQIKRMDPRHSKITENIELSKARSMLH